MKYASQYRSHLIDRWATARRRQLLVTLIAAALIIVTQNVWAADAAWEYKVVILQGVTAGGTIEKDGDGIYVDTKRTRSLNTLAAEGWEIVAVIGSVATDHTVYLRRRTSR